MDGNALKRVAVVTIAALFVVGLVVMPVTMAATDAPALLLAAVSVVCICLALAMAYYTVERLREINEGLDDAVDNY